MQRRFITLVVVDYLEVDGDHGGMVPMVWPAVFDFFDRVSARTTHKE